MNKFTPICLSQSIKLGILIIFFGVLGNIIYQTNSEIDIFDRNGNILASHFGLHPTTLLPLVIFCLITLVNIYNKWRISESVTLEPERRFAEPILYGNLIIIPPLSWFVVSEGFSMTASRSKDLVDIIAIIVLLYFPITLIYFIRKEGKYIGYASAILRIFWYALYLGMLAGLIALAA